MQDDDVTSGESPTTNEIEATAPTDLSDRQRQIIDDLSPEEHKRIVERGFWDKIRSAGSQIPFAREAIAACYAMKDEKVPVLVRVAIAAPLAYFVIPVDAIPDPIVALGFTDDLAVWMAAATKFGSYITDEHREAANRFLNGVTPRTDASSA